MQWTPDERGQNLSSKEVTDILKKAYIENGEVENYGEMIMQLEKNFNYERNVGGFKYHSKAARSKL